MIRNVDRAFAGLPHPLSAYSPIMFRNGYRVFTGLLLLLAVLVVQPAGACFKKKTVPAWVGGTALNEPGYYTGVGYAPKVKRQNNHVQKAREDALNELAAAVSVQIHSSNTWITIENNDRISEDYRSLIQSRVSTELEGVEQVESYEDKKGYWVYYRLSKLAHAATVHQRKMLAAQKSLSIYELAQKAELSGDYRQAIVNYAKALDAVILYLNESVQLPGSSVNLTVHPFERIHFLLNRLVIQSGFARLSAVTKGEMNIGQLPVELRDVTGTQVTDIPLSFWYSERAIAEPLQRTDSQGRASFRLPQVRSSKASELIVVSVDVQALLAEAVVGFEVRRAVLAMPVHKLSIPVDVRKPLIQLEIADNQSDESYLRELILPAYASELEKAGYSVSTTVVNNSSAADLRYSIRCTSRVTGQQAGIVKVQLTGTIQVYNPSGQLIFTSTISPVDGSHLSVAEATRQAYQTLATQLSKRYVF